MARVLAGVHAAVAALAGLYAAVAAPVALLSGDVASTWALAAVATAGVLALVSLLPRRVGLRRLVVLLHALAAFLFLGAGALPPAVVATALFALGIALLLRPRHPAAEAAAPPQP